MPIWRSFGRGHPTAAATARTIWTKQTVTSDLTVGDVMMALLAATAEDKGHMRSTTPQDAARPLQERVRPSISTLQCAVRMPIVRSTKSFMIVKTVPRVF